MNYRRKSLRTNTIFLLAFILFTHVLSAQDQKDAAKSKSQKNTDPSYSIFRETLVDLSWPDVKKAAEEKAIVILPVTVIEQHGPHLCLGTDTYIAYRLSLELKRNLEAKGVKAVIAPPMYWGIMQLNESGAFPGSFTVSPTTMKALLLDILTDLQRWGFRYIYCFNAHGDGLHIGTLNETIAEAKEKLGLAFYINREENNEEKEELDINKYVSGKLVQPDYHSGASETSLMMSYYPEFVNVDLVKTLKPEATWQPQGYVGDPANYKKINMLGFVKADANYQANCIVKWYKDKNKK